MNDAPIVPAAPQHTTQLKGTREALSQFVAEVCRDLQSGHTKLAAADTAEQLLTAATDTHKAMLDHGQAMGEYVQIVRNWREDRV